MPPPTKIVCLCPTFSRPWHVSSSLAMWLRQTHPAEERWLLIGDDTDGLGELSTERLRAAVRSQGYDREVAARVYHHKFQHDYTLPRKYNAMVDYALTVIARDADLLVVWEDDDLYLPGHLAQIARAWNSRNRPTGWWGHPELVLSDYTKQLQPEPAHGRFHASLAVSVDLWQRKPWVETPDGQFDQQYLQALAQHQPRARYDLRTANGKWVSTPSYVFRWHTGTPHGQAYMPNHGPNWQAVAKQALRDEFWRRLGAWDCTAQIDARCGQHIATATDNGRSSVALPIPVTPGPQ